jgi:hypothetical protein
MHVNLSPGSRAHSVGTEQCKRNRMLIPDGTRPSEPESLRQLGPIAQWAVESCSDPFGTFLGNDNPGPDLERWPVTNMLAVPARQLSDVVTVFITVETQDRSHHISRVSVRSPCFCTLRYAGSEKKETDEQSVGCNNGNRVRCAGH